MNDCDDCASKKHFGNFGLVFSILLIIDRGISPSLQNPFSFLTGKQLSQEPFVHNDADLWKVFLQPGNLAAPA
jgi:hypothetical protein